MKSKDVRTRVFFHPARRTDCVVEVNIVECSYDLESAVPGAVICCKVEFSPEGIKALQQEIKLEKKQGEFDEDAGHPSASGKEGLHG